MCIPDSFLLILGDLGSSVNPERRTTVDFVAIVTEKQPDPIVGHIEDQAESLYDSLADLGFVTNDINVRIVDGKYSAVKH